MWPTVLLGLLVASIAGWIATSYLQRQRIRKLERSHEEIQVEETLVFDFLHGLGEAFRETIRPQELHRLIVEGATRILDAHGGALYVTDRTGAKAHAGFHLQRLPAVSRYSDEHFATSGRLSHALLRGFSGCIQSPRTKA